jgi:hypothetical protein
MTPTRVLQEAIATLLQNDTTTLAAALALNLHLAKNPFVPSPSMDLTSFVEANFNGYAALPFQTGVQLKYDDPVSGLITVEMKPPTGGYHFLTTGVGNLPQTIYGYYITDNANAVLYGALLFDSGITLQASGQGFDVPVSKFAFVNNSPI